VLWSPIGGASCALDSDQFVVKDASSWKITGYTDEWVALLAAGVPCGILACLSLAAPGGWQFAGGSFLRLAARHGR
jgi:hypothetical protein